MSKKNSPSIFSTLQKTTEHASTANSELVRQLSVNCLEDNPMNQFSMAEDEEFQSTRTSVDKDGFLDDIIVTPSGEGKWRIVSGHRRVAVARQLGKNTVPCKVRQYNSPLDELRALMGANLHRRTITPFDYARQLQVLRQTLADAGQLPDGIKEQAERMAQETRLSRATVERYLDLWNLSPTLTKWAESGNMTLTDAYELARKKNMVLQPLVEDYVSQANEKDKEDFPALIHRAILWAKTMTEQTKPDLPKPTASAEVIRKVDSLHRALYRSTAQLQNLTISEQDRGLVQKKLDSCLEQLEQLKAQIETLQNTLY